jgi:hypothetical protein
VEVTKNQNPQASLRIFQRFLTPRASPRISFPKSNNSFCLSQKFDQSLDLYYLSQGDSVELETMPLNISRSKFQEENECASSFLYAPIAPPLSCRKEIHRLDLLYCTRKVEKYTEPFVKSTTEKSETAKVHS